MLSVAVMIFHVANAWQEGTKKDIIKLYACCFEEVLHILTLICHILSRLPWCVHAVLCLPAGVVVLPVSLKGSPNFQ